MLGKDVGTCRLEQLRHLWAFAQKRLEAWHVIVGLPLFVEVCLSFSNESFEHETHVF